MRGQPLGSGVRGQQLFNALLRTVFGLRKHPADLHDMLADIRTRLGNHETILRKLAETVESQPLPLTSPTPVLPTSPAFEFRDITKPPVINGKIKPKLTPTQHDTLMELLKAGPGGLSMEELDDKSGHPEARKALKKLAKDADWRGVILFPGKKGQGGYRLRFS